GCTHPGIVAAAEPDDEAPAVLADFIEVRSARVPAICEQEFACERRWFRKELALLLAVGSDLDRAHFVGEPAVGGVPLDRGGLLRREPAGEHLAQRLFERERRAVLNHDVVEPSD